ncbi:putative sterol delta 5,6-desaturase [Aspergillus avenaceus]|uniref:Putative sterol delta 5,6-desaturase n=1 Tax=Aspergillus avenaceus TaxID=36643 RepID=A0A5N6TF97_ASPAV|nr:putative sterol delta 5,6-desaturase [Aspergillus avenaceus]
MDVVLDVLDTLVFDQLYATVLPRSFKAGSTDHFFLNGTETAALNENINRYVALSPSEWATKSAWPRHYIFRQSLSLFLIIWAFGVVLYFLSATLSFNFVFDKRAMKHPKFLKNQMSLEIAQTMRAMPVMAALTVPFFLAEIRGYSKLYDFTSEAPFSLYTYLQYPLFIAFTDFGIYWIHRGEHHPRVYKHLHKPHHKWIISTPFASYAFHPVDGWAQSLPYHVYAFIFPLQKIAYLGLFTFVTIWTVMIHDGEYALDSPIVNGSACHTIHHYYFNYNYGQFLTLWDRIGGSYRKPNPELFDREVRLTEGEIKKQVQEMEKLVKEVEGIDDRCYAKEVEAKKLR